MNNIVDKTSIKLLKKMMVENEENNAFSYAGLCSVMSMILPALDGNTKNEVEKNFKIFDKDLSNKSKLGKVNPEVKNYNYSVLNDEYYSIKIKEEYKKYITDKCKADIFLVSKEKPMNIFSKKINKKIADLTNNKLLNVVDSESYKDLELFVSEMSNVIYFNGRWAGVQDGEGYKVITLDFKNQDGSVVNKDYFHSNPSDVILCENKGLIGFSLNYDSYDDRYKFFAFMPKDDHMDISKLSFDNIKYHNECKVYLNFPLFKVDKKYNMIPLLEQIGIHDLFDKNKADFRKGYDIQKCDNLWVKSLNQIIYFDVNEKGTEAATITQNFFGGLGSIGDFRKILLLTFNRPFIYFIYDEKAKVILFVGNVKTFEDNGKKSISKEILPSIKIIDSEEDIYKYMFENGFYC